MKPLTMTPGREAFWRRLADAPDATLSPIAEFEAGIAREFLPVIDALRAALAEVEAERDALVAVIRRVCPEANTEPGHHEAAFVCFNEDADPIIEADTAVEALEGILACWDSVGVELEKTRALLAKEAAP